VLEDAHHSNKLLRELNLQSTSPAMLLYSSTCQGSAPSRASRTWGCSSTGVTICAWCHSDSTVPVRGSLMLAWWFGPEPSGTVSVAPLMGLATLSRPDRSSSNCPKVFPKKSGLLPKLPAPLNVSAPRVACCGRCCCWGILGPVPVLVGLLLLLAQHRLQD
jgi:hypothetical protein